MNGYRGKHRRTTDPAELPAAMRGLANLIEVVPSKDSSKE